MRLRVVRATIPLMLPIPAQRATSPARAQGRKPVFNQPGAALYGTQTFPSVRRTGIPARFSSAVGRSLPWGRNQERLCIMRRVAIAQYKITASIAPQMSIITSRSEAVRDGTKD